MGKFQGIGTALITPFREGQIDHQCLIKLVERQIDARVDFLVALGTTGEASTLTNDEKQAVISTIVDANAGRLPVMIGVFGGNNTRAIIERFQTYDLSGVDALLSSSPEYNKPSQEGLFRHYEALSKASPLPLMIYNVPGRTGSNLTAETTLRIAAACPNIMGIKEASGDMMQGATILRNSPAQFQILSGDDQTALPLMSLGSHGVISVIANAFPSDFAKMTHWALQGDFEQARKVHLSLLPLHHFLYVEGNPTGVKACMEILGLSSAEVRLPLAQLSDVERSHLSEMMKTLQLSN